MANTYTKIYIHIVFAVKGRQSLIGMSFEENLYKYITGIVERRNHKLLVINGMPDHIHFLIGMHPDSNLSELVREIKKSTNQFIRNEGFCNGFSWQEGFAAFSHSRSQIDKVIQYILNQKRHHKKTTFQQEYRTLLQRFDIEFSERYLFESADQ